MILSWDEKRLAFMKDADAYNPGYRKALWQAILGMLPETPHHICDAGCGAGYLSMEMAKTCRRVTAIDLSEKATAQLREMAADLENLTVRTGDICENPPEELYDAMVFCYFGKTPEILQIAKAQCRGTLVMVTRNYTHHRFSLHPTAFDRDTVEYSRSVLDKASIPYRLKPCELEFGQPFRDLDAAAAFFTLYGGEAVSPEAVLPRLRKTDDPEFPYYLPSVKKMGIITVSASEL